MTKTDEEKPRSKSKSGPYPAERIEDKAKFNFEPSVVGPPSSTHLGRSGFFTSERFHAVHAIEGGEDFLADLF